MTEFILKTNVPPPEGWEYTGEFRLVSNGDWYLHQGLVKKWGETIPSFWCYPILRRKRWVPKPGEKYWYVDVTLTSLWSIRAVASYLVESGNCWRTKEQADAFAKACREQAEKIHDEIEHKGNEG